MPVPFSGLVVSGADKVVSGKVVAFSRETDADDCANDDKYDEETAATGTSLLRFRLVYIRLLRSHNTMSAGSTANLNVGSLCAARQLWEVASG